MAIGDPTTNKSSRRKGRRRTNKSGASKNYSPGFIEMAVTFLNKTPAEAGLFDASPKSAKGRAAAKKAKKLKDDIRDAGTKRNIQEVISRSEKTQNKKDAPSKSSAKTWRDFKSVDAARKAGLNYFTGKDGKKKIAITAEQLKKKGMTLREYANSIKGKK